MITSWLFKNFFKVPTLQHTLRLCSALLRVHCRDQKIIGGLRLIHKLYSKSILTKGKCTLHYWYLSRNINIEYYFAITKTVKFMNKTKENLICIKNIGGSIISYAIQETKFSNKILILVAFCPSVEIITTEGCGRSRRGCGLKDMSLKQNLDLKLLPESVGDWTNVRFWLPTTWPVIGDTAMEKKLDS